MNELTAEHVRELLNYDAHSGVMIWRRPSKYKPSLIGAVAGMPSDDGYLRIGIEGQDYLVHRVAWLWMTGEWPKGHVDHVDGDKAANAWANLREATKSQNGANMKIRGANRSGFKGVGWDKRALKFRARIMVDGIDYNLGYYATPERAHERYMRAAKIAFGQFARAA